MPVLREGDVFLPLEDIKEAVQQIIKLSPDEDPESVPEFLLIAPEGRVVKRNYDIARQVTSSGVVTSVTVYELIASLYAPKEEDEGNWRMCGDLSTAFADTDELLCGLFLYGRTTKRRRINYV
jgi:hypothetical protein